MSDQRDVEKVFAGLRAFGAEVRRKAESALRKMAADSVERAKDLVPVYKGHMRMSVTQHEGRDEAGNLLIRVTASSTVSGKGLEKPSRQSKRDPIDTQPVAGKGGSRHVNVAILMHELQTFESGPQGVPHGPFRYGRSGRDANPDGAAGTMDAGQKGRESTDGSRGGQFLRRIQRNRVANLRRWGKIARASMSVATGGYASGDTGTSAGGTGRGKVWVPPSVRADGTAVDGYWRKR